MMSTKVTFDARKKTLEANGGLAPLILMPYKFDAESTKKWEAIQVVFNALCGSMLTHLEEPVLLNEKLHDEYLAFCENYQFNEEVQKELFEEAVQMYERVSSWLFEGVKFKQYQEVSN
jgi:hypothetical protein